MALSNLAKYAVTGSTARPLCDSELLVTKTSYLPCKWSVCTGWAKL